jgi:hypothetical protein
VVGGQQTVVLRIVRSSPSLTTRTSGCQPLSRSSSPLAMVSPMNLFDSSCSERATCSVTRGLLRLSLIGCAMGGAITACAERSDQPVGSWDGHADTLVDGRVSIQNGFRGMWPTGLEWRVSEELRIGARIGEGPEAFGDVVSFAVDEQNRIWVLDGQASELHAFDRRGRHLLTLGGKGSGPGEFGQPAHVDISLEGQVWVMDPGNGRISVFDTDGSYVRTIRVPSPFSIQPWFGGFDGLGRYYMPVVRFQPRSRFRIDLAQFHERLARLDTLRAPTDPIDREEFGNVIDGQEVEDQPVPFQGALLWRLSRTGTIWALLTDEYRLFELNTLGDTLRVITKRFTPIPVTEEERQEALLALEPFMARGGRVNPARIPDHRPAIQSFFLAEDGHIWVQKTRPDEVQRTAFEVFNPRGQYLGVVTVPFRLRSTPSPMVRDGSLYGVARDEMDVQFVVRARIREPVGDDPN